MVVSEQMDAKPKKRRAKAKTQKVTKKKVRQKARPRTAVLRPVMTDDGNPYLMCEDTCEHVHGIDLSHYQIGRAHV